MSIKPAGNNNFQNLSQTSAASKPDQAPPTWTLDKIRNMRQNFEQETIAMRDLLGDSELQTMLVAMYEGTEQLLNSSVSDFAVMQYLEDLKQTALEFRQQGMTGNSYRSSLLEHSNNSLSRILVTG